MNNKGFTLIELLAVIVILCIISAVAVPSISTSIERTQNKQDKALESSLFTYTEMYFGSYKDKRNNFKSGSCAVKVSTIISKYGLDSHIFADYSSKYIKYDGSGYVFVNTGTEC